MDRSRTMSLVHRFFAGITEHAFQCRLGVADPPLVDYVAGMLTRFVHRDEIYRVRTPSGRRLQGVADMLLEAESRQGPARREVHRHIGDFTLFWTGLYPEVIPRMHKTMQKDSLLDYRIQGKRAYRIASTIPADETPPGSDLLQRLSDRFELCAYGLSEVRREWERRDDEGDSPLPILFN